MKYLIIAVLLICGCAASQQKSTGVPLDKMLLEIGNVEPGYHVIPGQTGRRSRSDYGLNDTEVKKFGLKDGYKIAFENNESSLEKHRIIFNYNSLYANASAALDDFEDDRKDDVNCKRILNVTEVGDDSYAFRCWRGDNTYDYTYVFTKGSVYETFVIRVFTENADQTEMILELVMYAQDVEKIIE